LALDQPYATVIPESISSIEIVACGVTATLAF
jgi:hypothetical protein